LRASDYEKEKCYTGATWAKQHKDPNCRYLKNRKVIETNRLVAWRNGAKAVCVHCWWNKPDPEEEKLSEMTELYDAAIKALERLDVKFKEPGIGSVILPALKERRRSLRKFLEG
jgi:hypothetical protein